MLVRYRAYANITLANLQSDITNIILGNVTSNADIVANLSTGANKGVIEIYGTYPTGSYQMANVLTNTFSKTHGAVAGYTHYIRLGYDPVAANSAGNVVLLANLSLAQSYISATDTLVNSNTFLQANIRPAPYTTADKSTIDIIVNNNMLTFIAPSSGPTTRSGTFLSIVDMGNSSTARTYANSMLMCIQEYSNVPGYGANTNAGGTIPYFYNYDTFAYGTIGGLGVSSVQTGKKFFSNTTSIVFENPTFTYSTGQGVINLLYDTYRLPYLSFGQIMLYRNSANAYRLAVNDMVFLVD